MFIGHYAASFVGGVSPKVKLWQAFIAVQFIDFVWAIFIILGIEQGRIVPGFTASNSIDLYFMPYSHSLLFCAVWAVIGALAFKVLTQQKEWTGALIFGALILSHWVTDVIVHVRDMTFWPGSEKIGFGLWNSLALGLTAELGLLALAYLFYLRGTHGNSARAGLWAAIFLGFLTAVQVINIFTPDPPNMMDFAVTALIAFTALALLAWRFERTRSFKT